MPTTNRPFFANFLAAFRAHSTLTKASSSTATSTVTTQSAPASSFTAASAQLNTPATARAITTKNSPPQSAATTTSAAATAAAVQAASNAFSHTRHPSATPHAQTSTVGRQPQSQSPTSPSRSAWPRRRGSDSSSDSGGFREVLGGEKWYVGGRTATGEERFLRLGMVHKQRSWERRSMDQLSL